MLHQVKSSVMVSNWYRHAKLCFRQQADKKLIQLPIHGYIGGPQRENDSSIATDSNKCSRKDSDTGSDTTIHGPIVDLAGFNKSSLNENKDVPNSQQLQASTLSSFLDGPCFQVERGAKQKYCFSLAWTSRKKRSLEIAASDPLQSRITDYWMILSNNEKSIKENEKLSLLLQQAYDASCEVEPCRQHISFTTILKEMICNAEKNCGQYHTHRRHPIILKKFATALFFLGL